ncbi:MAG TPA: DoxX family protein [Candidatus Aquilonibacter sp.]|nr:DoxX family protein [Candidatus Aquilonibacter sp.]
MPTALAPSHSRETPTRTSSSISPAVTFLGRLLFVAIFLLAGPRHFLSSTIHFAASQGAPLASIAVPLSGLVAVLGGLSILLGFRAKLGAWLIVAFLAAVTPVMHRFWAAPDPVTFQVQFAMFMKNVSMAGAALLISQFGAGPWSIDAYRS